jgi:hypothetical protein
LEEARRALSARDEEELNRVIATLQHTTTN